MDASHSELRLFLLFFPENERALTVLSRTDGITWQAGAVSTYIRSSKKNFCTVWLNISLLFFTLQHNTVCSN